MIKQKVLDLANHIGRKKANAKDRFTGKDDPEYMILEPVVTDEMADVCLTIGFREKVTAKEVAKRCGKSEAETYRILLELADVGVCFVNEIDGVDTFWYDTWVPGIMEMMVNHKENVHKYPQIAEAFEAYGRVRGPKSVGSFPVGIGLMRVIPIASSIDASSRKASYEELMSMINQHTRFSVSDCSCRTAREVMGEGCGHLKEDMCIQMGHGAEYYIRTKRGREVSKEEVLEILRQAEENGLMHEIPNMDGNGETHAICNCCGCGCLSMRSAAMFGNADMIRSNYVSRVDKDKCVACGECVINCPVNALKLGQKLCSTKPIVERIVWEENPRNTEWGPERWNPDYRTNRKNVVDTGTSPCKTQCPAHIAIQAYIKLASMGKYKDALELIKKENPFPAVCGRICPRSCESACTRADIDAPVAIDEIKKFIAQQDLNEKNRYIPTKRHDYGKKIAVVGAGPSGLACAYFLALDGYKVTVFEKETKVGGMLSLGIPAFRLEKDVVEAEIEILRILGVEFKTGIEIGQDLSLADLRSQGYKAFYLAIGAQNGRKLGLAGEEHKNVLLGIDFLRDVNLGKDVQLKGNVVVIGGGNVAIDVARTAIRSGATSVQMYCLESAQEIPALPEEIEEALSEGIVINHSWGVKKIIIENEQLRGIEFKRCTSVFDANQAFAPKFDENDKLTVASDYIISSVGQAINWGTLLQDSKVELNKNMTAKADPITLQSNEPDIFIGGDALTGPKFAIDAIALGKEAAISIHRFVQPGQNLVYGRTPREYQMLDKDSLEISGYDRAARQQSANLQADKSSFKDLRGTFTEEQMKKESERCLGCGATVVDEFMCVGCGQCTTKCKFDAIHLERVYDGQGVSLLDAKPYVVKTVLKRKLRILGRKLTAPFRKV